MDLRIKRTRQNIINAFIELRSKKYLEKITVKELCGRAMINKATFYKHFADIYSLSEYLETQTANEIITSLDHPEYLFSKPEEFNRQLFCAYVSHESLIQILFSGSRSSLLLVRIENSLKEIIFSIRPDYKNDAVANIVFTYGIYGGFYAFEKCRGFGDNTVMEIMGKLNKKIYELL